MFRLRWGVRCVKNEKTNLHSEPPGSTLVISNQSGLKQFSPVWTATAFHEKKRSEHRTSVGENIHVIGSTH